MAEKSVKSVIMIKTVKVAYANLTCFTYFDFSDVSFLTARKTSHYYFLKFLRSLIIADFKESYNRCL